MTDSEKEILLDWIKTFDVKPIETQNLSHEAVIKANEIFSKFQKFIAWSKEQIENI